MDVLICASDYIKPKHSLCIQLGLDYVVGSIVAVRTSVDDDEIHGYDQFWLGMVKQNPRNSNVVQVELYSSERNQDIISEDDENTRDFLHYVRLRHKPYTNKLKFARLRIFAMLKKKPTYEERVNFAISQDTRKNLLCLVAKSRVDIPSQEDDVFDECRPDEVSDEVQPEDVLDEVQPEDVLDEVQPDDVLDEVQPGHNVLNVLDYEGRDGNEKENVEKSDEELESSSEESSDESSSEESGEESQFEDLLTDLKKQLLQAEDTKPIIFEFLKNSIFQRLCEANEAEQLEKNIAREFSSLIELTQQELESSSDSGSEYTE